MTHPPQNCVTHTTLNPEIIHLTHNDFDAFGCILSVSTLQYTQKIFNTNYLNLKEIVSDLTDECYKTHVKMILITDVSFAGKKDVLQDLENLAIKLNVPAVLIDHHVHEDGFFDDFKHLKVIHDINYSASYLTYNFFKIKNENLSKIINICNTFDIWQEQKPDFLVSLVLNEYFWQNVSKSSIKDFSNKVLQNDYKIPSDFKTFYSTYIEETKNKIKSFKERKLIVSDGFFTVAFIDDYINMLLYNEFTTNIQDGTQNGNQDGTQFVMIANSYGVTRFRFNSQELQDLDLIHTVIYQKNKKKK